METENSKRTELKGKWLRSKHREIGAMLRR